MAKRSYGSGSLKLRGSVYYYRIYDKNGKRIEGSTKESNRKKAEAVLAAKITETAKHSAAAVEHLRKVAISSRMTCGDMLHRYMEERREEGRLGNDEYMITRSLIPFFGDLELSRLTAQHSVAYREYRRAHFNRNGNNAKAGTARGRKQRPSHSSIDRELRIFKAAIRRLWKQGHPLVPNLIHVELKNEDNKRKGFITPEEFVPRLLPQFSSHTENVAALLFCSGMRSGEALNLQKRDIDLAGEIVYIRDTKNGEPREVPIFAGLMRECLVKQLRYSDTNAPNSPYLFTYEGVHMTTFRRSWNTAIRKAGYEDLRPHDLRRSAAKNMRNAGIPGSIIMKIMGHKSQSMLERYGIIDANDIKAARDMMNIQAAEWSKYGVAS